MGDRSRLSTLSVYSNSIEDQIKNAMEENAGLKSYIDNMNKECLELNAALFEEANKMVTTARTKQQIAEKKLKEKNQENEMLRSQIQSLREVISKLPSPVSTASSPDWPPQKPNKTNSRKFNSSNRRHLHQSASLSSTPTLFRKSCENLSLMMSPDSESLLTTVSRNVLFDALLAEEHDADESDRLTFQDTPQSKGDKQERRRLILNISCEARNRIASVVSLFQYLKIVAHKSRSAVPPKSKLSESAKISDPLVHLDHSVIEKQFARIQRLRLGIAFARLGFGIPDAE